MKDVDSLLQTLISVPLILGGIGDIAEYVFNAVVSIFETLINGAVELTISVFNAVIWLVIGTPSPADSTSVGDLIGEPSSGGWIPFYEFFIESTQPLSIILLIAQVAIVIIFASGPFLFSNYDKERYFRRIFQAFVGVTAWWFLFTTSTQFANQLAMFLGGMSSSGSVDFAEFIEIGLEVFLTSASLILIGALASMASTALILFVAVMYLSRMVVIYGYSFSMPLFMALWPANVGFLKPVSELMKKFMELYIPILFLTLPNALILRTARLLGESAFTPSQIDVDEGVLAIGTSITGDIIQGILFLALALVLPIVAIIAPKYVFQATGGSFGRVVRSIERSRGLSTMGAGGGQASGAGGGGQSTGAGGGGQSTGAGGGQSTGAGGGRSGSRQTGGGRSGGGRSGSRQTGSGRSGSRQASGGDGGGDGGQAGSGQAGGSEQRNYQFRLGKSTFSTENAARRAKKASEGVDKAQEMVDNVKDRFTDDQRSTFQSIESRQKAYENDDGERVPVETTDPETIEDMDDQYVAPQTARDRYSEGELRQFDQVADTGDQYESPEPYYTPSEPETVDDGMSVDPETDPDYVGYEPTRQYSKANYDAYNARKDSDIDPDDVTSPYSDSSDGVVSGGGFKFGDVESVEESGSRTQAGTQSETETESAFRFDTETIDATERDTQTETETETETPTASATQTNRNEVRETDSETRETASEEDGSTDPFAGFDTDAGPAPLFEDDDDDDEKGGKSISELMSEDFTGRGKAQRERDSE